MSSKTERAMEAAAAPTVLAMKAHWTVVSLSTRWDRMATSRVRPNRRQVTSMAPSVKMPSSVEA